MPFQGFADTNGSFFRKLAKNQDRDWFQAHKEEFDLGWNEPMKALLEDVRGRVDAVFAHAELDEAKVFRIFRDVRFSKDKTPYKTHIGGHIATKRAGKPTEVPIALYFHVGHNQRFGAAGNYRMDGASLGRFRDALVDESRAKELDKILRALAKKGFAIDSHEKTKRVPRGFDPEHPRAELLKQKGLIASFPEVPKELLTSPKLVRWLADNAKAAAPLVEWLVFVTA